MPKHNETAKGFCLTSAFWMVIATFMGLLGATELIAPDLTENIGWLWQDTSDSY
jgi:cbb3-type cytochrome oxidase subunit 1